MAISTSNYVVLAMFLIVFLFAKVLTIGRRPKGYPPGPPTIPILGNIHLMPQKNSHLQFQKWAQEYGPIYSLILGTRTIIVLSTDTAVKELLDKRSGIYSSRLPMYMLMDLLSGGNRVLLMPYGPKWRMIRKFVHNILNIVAAKSYVPYQDLENKQLLLGFLDAPDQFLNHIRRYSYALTTQMVYGFRTSSIDDPKANKVFKVVENFSNVAVSGVSTLLDLFPGLKYLPDFMIPMRAHCKRLHEVERELFVGNWLKVKKEIKAGTAKPCFCVDLMKTQEVEQFSDDLAGYMSGSIFEAGSDTTTSELIGFMQALVLFPEVQKIAQEELDRVVGPDRLPTMEDEFELQYIRGCVKESLRWMPTTIMGIPHAVTKDDWYDGYLIPKGAGVIPNNWAIHMDPQRHANPRTFDPSRYANDFQTAGEATSNPDVSKRDHFTFGAGRRVCQGMHIAERSLFLAMSRILWAFNVEPATDSDGKQILPDPADLIGGLLVQPRPFPANITPKSEKHAAMIREQWGECLSLLDEDLQWKEVPLGMKFRTYDTAKQDKSEFD